MTAVVYWIGTIGEHRVMRNAAFIAALGLASIGIGTALALTTPTQLRTARDGQLAELSQPKIITYPGQANLTGGADS